MLSLCWLRGSKKSVNDIRLTRGGVIDVFSLEHFAFKSAISGRGEIFVMVDAKD